VSKQPLVLTGMEGLRLLSAFQALDAPSGFYRVTHKRVREIISDMTGRCPIRGRKSGHPPRDHENVIQWYCDWLMENSRPVTRKCDWCRYPPEPAREPQPRDLKVMCPACLAKHEKVVGGV